MQHLIDSVIDYSDLNTVYAFYTWNNKKNIWDLGIVYRNKEDAEKKIISHNFINLVKYIHKINWIDKFSRKIKKILISCSPDFELLKHLSEDDLLIICDKIYITQQEKFISEYINLMKSEINPEAKFQYSSKIETIQLS